MKKVFCVVLIYMFLEVSINSLSGCSRWHTKNPGSKFWESIENVSNETFHCKIFKGKAGSLPEFQEPCILPKFNQKAVFGEISSLFIHMFEFSRPKVFIIPEESPVIHVEDDEDFSDELSSYDDDDDHSSHESGDDTTVDFNLEEVLDFDELADGNDTSSDETWHMEMEGFSAENSETESCNEGTELSASDDTSVSCCDCCRDSSVDTDRETADGREETEAPSSESESTGSENENTGSQNENTDSDNEDTDSEQNTSNTNQNTGSDNDNIGSENENTDSENEDTGSENESTDKEHETDSKDEGSESDENNGEADSESSGAITKNNGRAESSDHDYSGYASHLIEIGTSSSTTVQEGSGEEEHNLQDILITADYARVDMNLYIDENQLQPPIEPQHKNVWSNGQFDALQSIFRDVIRTPGRSLLSVLPLLIRFVILPTTKADLFQSSNSLRVLC